MEEDYTENFPFSDNTTEVYDVETEKELILKEELKNKNQKNEKRN